MKMLKKMRLANKIINKSMRLTDRLYSLVKSNLKMKDRMLKMVNAKINFVFTSGKKNANTKRPTLVL